MTPDAHPSAPPAGTPRRDFLKGAAIAGLGATSAGSLLVGHASARGKAPGSIAGLPGEASLGGNIGKSLFYTINVSDLDRAVEFYEATYPVALGCLVGRHDRARGRRGPGDRRYPAASQPHKRAPPRARWQTGAA